MAQVTYGTPAPARHVIGDLSMVIFVVNGASGSTLQIPGIPVWVNRQAFCQAGTASLITGILVAGTTVTFTSSAPMVNEVIQVISRIG